MATWSEPTATHPITRTPVPMRRAVTTIAAAVALASGTGTTIAAAQPPAPASTPTTWTIAR